jgi:plastocyanin
MLSFRVVMVASLIALAAACGGYSSSEPSPVPPATPTPSGPSSAVTIPSNAETLGNRAYAPDSLSVDVGATVTWTNNDFVDHTTTSDGTGWNSGVVAPGGKFSVTFQSAGTFPYHCTLHPSMVGTVVVR